MNVSSIGSSAFAARAAAAYAKPAAAAAAVAKPAAAQIAPVDSDGDHDGSTGGKGRLDVMA